jgi:hypothetical protein
MRRGITIFDIKIGGDYFSQKGDWSQQWGWIVFSVI